MTDSPDLRERYLNLLAAGVTHTLYDPPDTRELPLDVQEAIRAELERTGETLVLRSPQEERAEGRDWPRLRADDDRDRSGWRNVRALRRDGARRRAFPAT